MPVVVPPDDGTTGNKCPAAGGGDTNKCHSVEHGGVDTVNMGPNLSHLATHGRTIFLFNYADNNMDDALLLW